MAKEIVELALPLEGLTRQDGIHAAGVVIGAEPLTNVVPIQQKGADQEVVTQFSMKNVEALFGNRLAYCDRPYGALEGADALAIVTEWPDFRNPDFEVMRRLLKAPVIFDGRNVYEPKQMETLGFTYYGIGRGAK